MSVPAGIQQGCQLMLSKQCNGILCAHGSALMRVPVKTSSWNGQKTTSRKLAWKCAAGSEGKSCPGPTLSRS